jgi:hypothetical protein
MASTLQLLATCPAVVGKMAKMEKLVLEVVVAHNIIPKDG